MELLGYSRVQDTLCYLRQQNRPVTCKNLAHKIASWESGQPSSKAPDELIHEISDSLQHDYLPKLVEIGLIEREQKYDEEYLRVTDKINAIEADLNPRSELGPTEYRVE
ncbi:DUF7344 domain-containing protein [Haladaptatus pallidirubidus]|uniref:DUF7344 domain-containing protein n=1 Tax=Haladaptatus pallidirubidus TaxID=1008152 RepID=UPI003CD091F3